MASTEARTATETARAVSATADPGPLGLAGFAATTLVLSFVNAGLVNAGAVAAVLPLALFYGGLAQLLAGLLEFRRGNTFGTTAFTTYGAFWLAFAFYGWFFEKADTPASATGLFLLVFTIVTAYLTIAALRINGAVLAVFVLLTLTFLFLTIGAFADSPGIHKLGGWLGIVTAVVAFYASAATVINETWKRAVVPVFPL
jgi:hypothetical protein